MKSLCELPVYYKKSRPEMVDFLPENVKSILEIGCGTGQFRKNIGFDCEYWGVEPEINAAQVAIKSLTRVLIGTFEQVQGLIPEKNFDVVICNDVIEHMVDHEKFLSEIVSKINPGGVLIGSIPNVRYIENIYSLLVKKEWRYEDEGILDKTHLRFFTEISFKNSLESRGLKIIKFHGINRLSINSSTAKKLFRSLFFMLMTVAFGADSRCYQFGFSVRVDH